MLFNQWIEKVSSNFKLTFHKPLPGRKVCTFVTWSGMVFFCSLILSQFLSCNFYSEVTTNYSTLLDWDLAVCLQNEVKRKQLRKSEILSQWIDLRASYRVIFVLFGIIQLFFVCDLFNLLY